MARPTTPSSVQHRYRLAATLPALVQQDITIYCPRDHTRRVYTARVLTVEDLSLRVSLPRHVTGNGYLRTSAEIMVNFVIGGRLYEAPADYRADDQHSREVILVGDIVAATRRRFARIPLQMQAGYVPVSDLSLSRRQFANLRWKQCRTLDLSGGGILMQIPFQAPVNSYLLMNIEIPTFGGPQFIFGQVRWFGISDISRTLYLCGVKFIPMEKLESHFSGRALSDLPDILMQFDTKKQKELDAWLQARSGRKRARR